MPERVALICGHCSFRFTRGAESKLSKMCPNCGQKNVHHYKPLNAEYFLKTVSA